MDIAQLVAIAVAGADAGRVQVAPLEPCEVEISAVGGLAQILTELVDNASSFSGPGQTVTINGVFHGDGYLITISDDGVGMSEGMLEAANRILQNPRLATDGGPSSLGVALVARLAERHGLVVRLVPGVPGTTARVTIPQHRLSGATALGHATERKPPVVEELLELTETAEPEASRTRHVAMMSPVEWEAAETFLESVFAPLRGKVTRRERPADRPPGAGDAPLLVTRPPIDREPRASSASLKIRIPGENFSLIEDEPSVSSSEAAIDLRSALSRYEDGRKEAAANPG